MFLPVLVLNLVVPIFAVLRRLALDVRPCRRQPPRFTGQLFAGLVGISGQHNFCPALVRLHPDDMEAMAQPLREEMDSPGVQWMADASVPPGGCLVESAGTVVDGSLDKRWQRAIAALGLQSPWEDEEGGDEH